MSTPREQQPSEQWLEVWHLLDEVEESAKHIIAYGRRDVGQRILDAVLTSRSAMSSTLLNQAKQPDTRYRAKRR